MKTNIIDVVNELNANQLPALLIHSDDTVSVVLNDNQINRIKLCSKDVMDTIEKDDVNEWYSFSRVSEHGLVTVVRFVRPHLRMNFSDHIDVDNIKITPHKLTDWYDMVDESLTETKSSILLSDILRIVK